MNNSTTSRTFSNSFIISVTIIFSTTALLFLLENILVIVAFLCSRQLRQVRSNLFLVGLAIADIFTSLTLIPFQLVEIRYSPNWPLGVAGVKVYNSFWNFCTVVPFLTFLISWSCHLCGSYLDLNWYFGVTIEHLFYRTTT